MAKTLLQFLRIKQRKSLYWLLCFYWEHFLNFIYKRGKKEEKVLNHAPKISKTQFPTENYINLSEQEKLKLIADAMVDLKVALRR